MNILIIVPCYNEGGNIENTVNSIISAGYDYVVVNDGSRDDSLGIIERNGYCVLDLSNNIGIGGAMQTGYKYAYKNNYDIAVQFDGDGQHNINNVEAIIDPLCRHECNMVIGSRFVTDNEGFKSSALRRIGIKLLSSLMEVFTGKQIKDMTSGFRAIDKSLIKLFSEKYPFEYPEPVTNLQVVKKGYDVKEVAVTMNERVHGRSSIHGFKNVYYMLNVILQFIITEISGEGEI